MDFKIVNHINTGKSRDELDRVRRKDYSPYLINKALSYFPDTIFHSNEMNILHGTDEKMQYDYLKYSVRKRKRFSKWVKNEKIEHMDLIKEYFNYSNTKAQESLRVLTDDQISKIKQEMNLGGVK